MSTTTISISSRLPGRGSYCAAKPSIAEAAVCGYFTFLPLLWLCGLTLPAAFLIFFGIFAVYVRNVRGLLYAAPWLAVGGAQYLSVIINWFATNQSPAILIKHLVASYVSGWLLLGCAIGIGVSGIIRPQVVLRNIVRISYYSLALAVPAYLLAVASPQSSLFILSPVGHLVPESFASRTYSFGIFVYNWDTLGGMVSPRLSLMSPWPTAMGMSGVCMIFVAQNITVKWTRRWAVAGACLMVFASMGRLAYLALVICGITRWVLNWQPKSRIVACCTLASLLTLGVIGFGSPAGIVAALSDRFNDARAGASEVRDAVYEASWRGFRESPWVGHGWPGESVEDNVNVYDTSGVMVVGSHSTVSGLLYKGGVMTFATLLFAFGATLYGVITQRDTAIRRTSLTMLLAIGLTCLGEGLESLVLPMLFAFLWIGTSIGFNRSHTAPSTGGVRRSHIDYSD